MICRVCLNDRITEVINIFDEIGVELMVCQTLSKYFWFEPKRDDPISTAICNSCWIHVSNFHEFYTNVEDAHRRLTERFSIKTEDNKPHKRRLSVNNTLPNKHEPSEDPEEEEFQFKVFLGGELSENETPSENALSVSDKKFEDTFDGEVFMDNILDDIAVHDHDKLEPLEEEESPPRSTRANTRANASHKSSSPKESNESPSEVIDVTPLKKRRGRPPKNSLDQAKGGSGKKSKSHKTTTSCSAVSPNSTTYEAKMREVDAKIAEHMRLMCDICALELQTFAQLRQHIEKMHHCKGYAVCCSKKFYKRVLLMDHIEKHINPDRYKCDDCDKIFADKQCMRNHFLLKHQPDEVKTFECDRCPKKFAKPYLLEQHRVIHEERSHICDVCQKGFATATLLSTHIKIIHTNYGTMCDICAKVIRGRAAFAKHQLEHAGVTLPKVQCDKCGSWHKDKYSLQKHKRRHNDDGTLHVCSICGKVAPNRSALLSHNRYVHASERTYECGVCKKAFKKPINLKEHMAMHTGEVLYKCPYCPKTFNSNANMHSHRKKVHPKEFEEARKNRRENASKAEPAQPIIKATDIQAADSMSTIKSADDNETHTILVQASGVFRDDDGNNSIIFTVN